MLPSAAYSSPSVFHSSVRRISNGGAQDFSQASFHRQVVRFKPVQLGPRWLRLQQPGHPDPTRKSRCIWNPAFFPLHSVKPSSFRAHGQQHLRSVTEFGRIELPPDVESSQQQLHLDPLGLLQRYDFSLRRLPR